MDGGDLLHDVDAVLVALDHLRDALDMTLNGLHPEERFAAMLGFHARKEYTPPRVGWGEVLYDQAGKGNQTTADFTVPSQWLLYWSFACEGGSTAAGSLKIDLYLRGVDEVIKSFSNPAGKPARVEHNYIGDGRHHLAIETVCQWRVTVTPAQGQSVTASPSSSP